jgi:hypothetical protein
MRIVTLGATLGHQRAVAVGLTEALADRDIETIVVMDADGEDDPSAVLRLVTAVGAARHCVVVAQRGARSESRRFRAGYRLYRTVFRVLTGKTLDYGNFCAMTREAAERLTFMPETWSHFAAAVMRSRLSLVRIKVDRAARYAGESRMHSVALVNHGLAAVSTFIDVVFIRLLVAVGAAMMVTLSAGGAAVLVRLFTPLAIPGWATTVLGFASLALVQFLGVLAMLTFVVLASRTEAVPIPRHVASQHVKSVTIVL